jgi:hypothetical protein
VAVDVPVETDVLAAVDVKAGVYTRVGVLLGAGRRVGVMPVVAPPGGGIFVGAGVTGSVEIAVAAGAPDVAICVPGLGCVVSVDAGVGDTVTSAALKGRWSLTHDRPLSEAPIAVSIDTLTSTGLLARSAMSALV